MLSWSTLSVEVEVDAIVLRRSLVIKTVASALREVSHQQVAAEDWVAFCTFLWSRITDKAEGLAEF